MCACLFTHTVYLSTVLDITHSDGNEQPPLTMTDTHSPFLNFNFNFSKFIILFCVANYKYNNQTLHNKYQSIKRFFRENLYNIIIIIIYVH